MRVEAVDAGIPERVVTNQEIIDIVKRESAETFAGNLDPILDQVAFYLSYIGNENRHWLEVNEPAFKYTEGAINGALEKAGLDKGDIDLLIHSSVDRRVVEPGMSFFIAKAMGMKHCQCFDVLEACNSWTRAAFIAQSFLKTNTYKKIMIITTEFAVHEGEWGFNSFKLKKTEDLEWAFAPYTMGEMATATILSAEGEDWDFDIITRPEHANLCMCPIDDIPSESCKYMNEVSLRGQGPKLFISYGKELQRAGSPYVKEMFKRCGTPMEELKVLFPHTHSKIFWENIKEKVGMDIPYYYIFPEYGNLVSCSTPASLALSISDGTVERGDKIGAFMVAAGMSFALYTFAY